MENTVSIISCKNYDMVEAAVKKAVDLLGGMERFVKKGDRVLIKPNYVSKKKPEEAVTTDPAFLHAVIRLAEQAGGKVTIAESPGGAYNSAVLKGLYAVCGAEEAVVGTGAVLNYDCSFSEVSFMKGETVKSFPIIDPILNADVIISLPKLKTHAMTSYTGAVKNLFGVIPGTHKAEMHFRLDDRKAFCSMLVDLCECVKPTLSIMDGVIGMEGNGPTAGQNRYIGLVLASANPHVLDLSACHIIDYRPEEVDTVQNAIDRGLCPKGVKRLNILGEDIEKLVIHDFLKPESHFNLLKLISLPEALNARVVNALASRPKINDKECVGCGECARCCPPKAIDMSAGKPEIDTKRCIRCFCCQELCPQKAVKIHRPIANRLMLKVLK